MNTVMMIDAIGDIATNIPESTPKVAGYVTGSTDIEWTGSEWAHFDRSGHVRINQGYNATGVPVTAWDVLDVEAGAFNPAEIPGIVGERIKAGITWSTIYGTDAKLAAVQAALEAAGPHGWYFGHVDAWLADWNLSEAEAAAKIGTLIHGMTCRAVQWASPTSNPSTLVPGSTLTLAQANVDLSVTEADWHAYVPPKPPVDPSLLDVFELAVKTQTQVGQILAILQRAGG